MNMPKREYWETTQDPDGTWVVWKEARAQSSGFADLDAALAYISSRARHVRDVTIEYADHSTEVRSF